MDLRSVTAQTFLPHRDSEFRIVRQDGAAVTLRLRDVDAHGLQAHAPRTEPFSLVFVGPPEPGLRQGIYQLRHDALGDVELFLVPIGYDVDGGRRYEAVFN